MIHLHLTCDRRRTKNDGTNPIVFRISVDRKSRDIPTGLSCLAQQWDFKKQCIRSKTDDLKVLANRINDMELNLLKKIRKFEQEHPFGYDVQEVKNYLTNKRQNNGSVRDFWLSEIERMHRAKKHSNARNYRSALLGLELTTNMDISFEKINYNWLSEVETCMRERGLKTTSVSVYLRTLRSIYNRAINLNLVDQGLYPFRRYKIQNGSSTPRSLTLVEMKQFFNYEPTSERMRFAHDMGKLIFMLRGINFTDLALMTTDNVKNGRIVYYRSKTHKLYSVKMLQPVEQIIKTHRSDVNDLLLCILSENDYTNKKKLPEQIMQRRRVLNNWLQKIGTTLELDEQLTTYTFRYSHANICRELGYSKDLISQSLGHSYGLRVTDAYLNDYDMGLIDRMNEHVVNEVLNE